MRHERCSHYHSSCKQFPGDRLILAAIFSSTKDELRMSWTCMKFNSFYVYTGPEKCGWSKGRGVGLEGLRSYVIKTITKMHGLN